MRKRSRIDKLRPKIWVQGAQEDMGGCSCYFLDSQYRPQTRERYETGKATQNGYFSRIKKTGILPDGAARIDAKRSWVHEVNGGSQVTLGRLFLPLWTFADKAKIVSKEMIDNYFRSLPRTASRALARRPTRTIWDDSPNGEFEHTTLPMQWNKMWTAVEKHVPNAVDRLTILAALCRETNLRGYMDADTVKKLAKKIRNEMVGDPVFGPFLRELFRILREEVFPTPVIIHRRTSTSLLMGGELIRVFENESSAPTERRETFEQIIARTSGKRGPPPVIVIPENVMKKNRARPK